MINKILVAVERSDKDNLVFDSALSLAKTTNATLMLLHVLSENEVNYPILPTYAYYPILDDLDDQKYQEQLSQYKQLGIDFLQNLTQKATESGVNTEYTQSSGNPGRKICELASTWEADLILVGSRGLKGFKEMFLGSVSNYVTHHAPCSVLIMRNPLERESASDSTVSEEKPATTDSQQLTT
ncbi:Universal stress protein [Hyella patelloides LEGE 07179]|uniref:Universal stress protein n=1 Tax=Hyella patelloides LEGE 07179 TaxID=945734 RepID=A0A563VXP2_9CYAN|nr:universal stress protein [Hyella patelloides]VEP16196.1 Universal stress protein [Hyella patelloides LEGE 07179]